MGKPQARSRKHTSKDKRKDIKTKRRVKGKYSFLSCDDNFLVRVYEERSFCYPLVSDLSRQ